MYTLTLLSVDSLFPPPPCRELGTKLAGFADVFARLFSTVGGVLRDWCCPTSFSLQLIGEAYMLQLSSKAKHGIFKNVFKIPQTKKKQTTTLT
jgi:hypothetical protein